MAKSQWRVVMDKLSSSGERLACPITQVLTLTRMDKGVIEDYVL